MFPQVIRAIQTGGTLVVDEFDASIHPILYALSDFGTTGEKGVRKHEDYMKNYFVSQYGAIKDIDFTPIFEEFLVEEGEV